MPNATAPVPDVGAAFRLDGLTYELGATGKIPNEERTGFLTVREVTRPTAVSEEEAAALKANFHYKRSVSFLEGEMVWLDRETWIADLREQVETLARSRPQARVWAEEAAKVLEEAYNGTSGVWALPGRHLLKPPVRFNPNVDPATGAPIGYETFLPQDRKKARQLAEAILASAPCPVVPLVAQED